MTSGASLSRGDQGLSSPGPLFPRQAGCSLDAAGGAPPAPASAQRGRKAPGPQGDCRESLSPNFRQGRSPARTRLDFRPCASQLLLGTTKLPRKTVQRRKVYLGSVVQRFSPGPAGSMPWPEIEQSIMAQGRGRGQLPSSWPPGRREKGWGQERPFQVTHFLQLSPAPAVSTTSQ